LAGGRAGRRPVTGALRPCRAPDFALIIATANDDRALDRAWRRLQGILPVSLDNAAMAPKLLG